jgi:hypothetical protein
MNSLDTLDKVNTLETSIIIQKELDKCNKKMKDYEIKNNIHTESLKVTYKYLNELLLTCDEIDKKIIMDDINALIKYV